MTLQVDGGSSLLRNDSSPSEFPVMTLTGIIDEICNRVNDPFNDNYGTRAESLFLSSLYENLSDERFTPFDYHGLVGKNIILTGSEDKRVFDVLSLDNDIDNSDSDLDGLSSNTGRRYINRINAIVSYDVSSQSDISTRKFVPISIEEANRIATDSELEPIYGEVYWYMIAENLYFHPSPSEDMRNVKFVIEYIHTGDNYIGSEDICRKFSIPYILACIDTATGKLLQEVNLA
tara:strand:- start:1109 stop:1807 length:699 start_codon:yes stop_codon:yes gene_type:complete